MLFCILQLVLYVSVQRNCAVTLHHAVQLQKDIVYDVLVYISQNIFTTSILILAMTYCMKLQKARKQIIKQ